MKIPKDHPRYESLMTREMLVEGMKNGLVAMEGLMAHGRGEAFDYLIGEKTQPFSKEAMEAAIAIFLTAERPVLSVNGNVAALVPDGLVKLAKAVGARLEANIFYRTEDRVQRIVGAMKDAGAEEVLGIEPDARIEGLDGPRGLCAKDGIFSADVVFVPLEDGDRTEALKRVGKVVVTVDLNPLSRTAVASDVTIVDNVVRAIPEMIKTAERMKVLTKERLGAVVDAYDNQDVISQAIRFMADRLGQLGDNKGEG
jgi:4-phosphopantoate--beta-alanine ligase